MFAGVIFSPDPSRLISVPLPCKSKPAPNQLPLTPFAFLITLFSTTKSGVAEVGKITIPLAIAGAVAVQ